MWAYVEQREDGLNIPKPHVVFAASGFKAGSDWHDQEEVSLWDKRVAVSFQENAWVDSETHMFWMDEVSFLSVTVVDASIHLNGLFDRSWVPLTIT